MKKTKKQDPGEPIFVGVENPSEVRRNILESTKGMIRILQSVDRQKTLRKEKELAKAHLNDIMSELGGNLSALKTQLPHVKLKDLPKKKSFHEAPEEQPVEVLAPEKDHYSNEADKLEAELHEIEKKLNELK